MINRRELCQGAATVALAAAFGAYGLRPLPVVADDAPASEGKVTAADLMKPQALPDMIMGSDKATVTIVEYASMTCPHCAHFDALPIGESLRNPKAKSNQAPSASPGATK